MLELWQSIQNLWLAEWVSLLILTAVLWGFWYLIALAAAHLLFGRGSEATDAAVNGMWISLVLITVVAVVLGLYYWLSLPVAVSLGVLAFMIPLIVTLALASRARA